MYVDTHPHLWAWRPSVVWKRVNQQPGILRKSVNGSGTPKRPKKRYSQLCN